MFDDLLGLLLDVLGPLRSVGFLLGLVYLEEPLRHSALIAVEHAGLLGQPLPLVLAVVQRADRALSRSGHEADDCQQGGADGPGGLPGLGVVAGDGQADFTVGFEAAVGLQKERYKKLVFCFFVCGEEHMGFRPNMFGHLVHSIVLAIYTLNARCLS